MLHSCEWLTLKFSYVAMRLRKVFLMVLFLKHVISPVFSVIFLDFFKQSQFMVAHFLPPQRVKSCTN